MKQVIGSVLAITLFAANAAWADGGNLEKAARILDQQSRAGKGEFITYLTGAAAAYRWAGTNCPPLDAQLDGRGYAKIALNEYQQKKGEYAGLKDFPLNVLALALMRGLQEKFPCRAEEPSAAVKPVEEPAAAVKPQ